MGRHLVRAEIPKRAWHPWWPSTVCRVGDVAESDDGKASRHLDAVLGLQDGSVRGHSLSGSVRPTLEFTINETVKHMRRKERPNLGTALLNI
jgi:uncharacterized protein